MTRKLIVNADGFGFTRGNNKGILECLPAGVVTSVSVNANFSAVQDVPKVVEQFPRVSVGIHLDLSVGPCVCDPKDVPALVDAKGEFLGPQFPRKLLRGKIPHQQMVMELTAQVHRLKQFASEITHWDSHQNMHLYPQFFNAAMEVAKRFGITRMRTHKHYLFTSGRQRLLRAALHLATHPRRAAIYWHTRRLMRRARRLGMRMADRLISPGILNGPRKFRREFWIAMFDRLPEGTSEVYCHPGYPDETLADHASYVDERLEELEILRDFQLGQAAAQRGVELISFREL